MSKNTTTSQAIINNQKECYNRTVSLVKTLLPLVALSNVTCSPELRMSYTTHTDVISYGSRSFRIKIEKIYGWNRPTIDIEAEENVGTNYNSSTPSRVPAPSKKYTINTYEQDRDSRTTEASYIRMVERKLNSIIFNYAG